MNKKWYQKKRYIIPLAVTSVVVIVGLSNQDQNPAASTYLQSQNQSQIKSINTAAPDKQAVQQLNTQSNTSQAPSVSTPSNPTYYTNDDGNKVQSPTRYDSVPAGATARCGDGTYSFSQHRSGTCSHHGGVTEWNP